MDDTFFLHDDRQDLELQVTPLLHRMKTTHPNS